MFERPIPSDLGYDTGYHPQDDPDAYLDAAVEEEDRLEDQDEPVFYDDSEDYYRSLLFGEDI